MNRPDHPPLNHPVTAHTRPLARWQSLLALGMICVVLLLAHQLRVYRLGDANLNWDEGYSTWLVGLPLAEMIETTARDVHPPAYYLLLRLQRTFTGNGEFVLRYPSALLGVLATAAAFGLARTLGGWPVGLLAALLLALSRANIEISQLMRMHMLAGVFSVGALWAAALILSPHARFAGRRWRREAIYIACTAGALHSFYLAVVLPLATNLAFVLIWWRRGRPWPLLWRWAVVQTLTALLFLPWALYAVQRMHGWNAEQPTSFVFFLQVYLVTLTTGISAHWEAFFPLVLAVVGALGVGAGAVYRADDRRDGLILLLAALLMPILVVFLLTLPVHNLGRPLAARYLLMLSASFYVLLAWGLVTLWRTHSRTAHGAAVAGLLLALSAALLGTSTAYDNRILRDQFASAVDTLRAHRQADDALILHNDRAWTALAALYPGGDWLNIPHEASISTDFAAYLLEPLWAQSDGVWLLRTAEALVNDPQNIIATWLAERAVTVAEWAFNEGTLTFYARTPQRASTAYDLADDFSPPPPLGAEAAAAGLLSAALPLPEYPQGDAVTLALYWSQPPTAEISLALVGQAADQTATFPPPPPAAGLTRQSVSLRLTPDLPPGEYRVLLAASSIELGRFRLMPWVRTESAAAETIDHPLLARFGDAIHLLGYSLRDEALVPGADVEITLFWRTDTSLTERYKVSAFVLGGQFNPATNTPLWGQQDAEPLQWTLPTTRWPPGEIIADTYRFVLDSAAPPGEYVLGVALYGAVDGVRLAAYTTDQPSPTGDYVPLRTFQISP